MNLSVFESSKSGLLFFVGPRLTDFKSLTMVNIKEIIYRRILVIQISGPESSGKIEGSQIQ